MKSTKKKERVRDFTRMNENRECIVRLEGFEEDIPSLSNKVIILNDTYYDGSVRVGINWEDKPYGVEDYRDYGLYGMYSDKYYDIDYDVVFNTLTIHVDDEKKIILTY